jgi:AraC-like DNA-binding protein
MSWQFSTDSVPPGEQLQAWRGVMSRLCLPVGALPDTASFRGKVSCVESPLGMEFALVDAQAHEISGRYLNQPAAIWLTLLLEGEAVLGYGGREIALAPGDIVYGPTFVEASLRFRSAFRQFFIKVNRLTLNPRVFAPLSLNLGHLPARSGISHVFSGMLHALADVIDEVAPEQLRPIELSLTEFLITSLGGEKSVFGLGGVAGARAYQLHRICQRIEAMLGDPNLSLAMVAQAEGVSTRYLQKLFTEAGNSFSHFLRTRRLERCRGDLISPRHADLSISEICFRWGFNGSAHFSRVFRKEYGVSPRDYRRSGGHPHDVAHP